MPDIPILPSPTKETEPRPHDDSGLRRYVLVMAALVLTVTALYFAKDIFILLFASGLFAFLLLPITRKLERLRFPTWLAALLSCLVMLFVVLGVIAFIGSQYARFGADLPTLKASVNVKMVDLQNAIEDRFHFSKSEQTAMLNKQFADMADGGGSIAMDVAAATGSVVAELVLLPIFTFFFLLLKGKFRTFFSQLSEDHSDTVLNVVQRISELSRRYMKGVVTVMLILSVLNSVGFLMLGLKYAIVLGVTASILNVVPYVGVWVGSLLPIMLALITKDSPMYALGALGVVLVTQFIDNNFITPKVVGSSVSINPLASIVSLLVGGMLWGVVGLVLAIPITGMLKIICDEIPGLKPWGFLLGEERVYPVSGRFRLPFIETWAAPEETERSKQG